MGFRLGVALALAAIASARPTGQSPPAPPQEQPPRIRVEANFVRVDVYPVREGNPVTDLVQGDFEVFEDNVRQELVSFEHVFVTPAGPQAERIEPNSAREGNEMAADPRRRVLVLFLDNYHVTYQGSHDIRGPIIRLLERTLSEEDLVGVMTPSMAATELTLARRTQVIEEGLTKNWVWGIEQSITQFDDTEERYQSCYQFFKGGEAIAAEMIARRREKRSIDALHDLVTHLRAVREERKAILVVSDGWRLFRPSAQLAGVLKDWDGRDHIPGPPPIGITSTGKLVLGGAPEGTTGALYECDRDRQFLANLDNDHSFRDIVNLANWANASFYTVDPRGLPAFDSPIGPKRPPPPHVDQAILRNRINTLRTLADATDGIAAVESNDLDESIRRIVDDLTSYYLLGYYSTNTKLDGRYRTIDVRVKRPGVHVRARRGYQAPTEEEVAAARLAADPLAPDAAASAFATAMSTLSRIRPDAQFRINVAAIAGAPGTLWVAGEVVGTGRTGNLSAGGTADLDASAGGASSTARIRLQPGQRAFLATLKLPGSGSGPVDVRARVSSDSLTLPVTDSVRVDEVGPTGQPLLFRRGPSTGNRVLPAADFRFSRTERVRIEIPVEAGVEPGAGRVLDQTGKPLGVPVTVAVRDDDPAGQRWVTAEVQLAPLAPADYAIEIATRRQDTEHRLLTAIRVVR
ncbi:MAG TPA: VWA domain-containing protein [Vicinamibacterales bacterium]|nr:VWA domain-containing protein [Vicinamibacterales bacterium]